MRKKNFNCPTKSCCNFIHARDARREGAHPPARGAFLTKRYFASHHISHNLSFTSSLTITPQQAEDPRRPSILAHFLCAIRIAVVLACLIVEMVTTCAPCMWVICANPTFLGVCPSHSYRHHLIVQIREAKGCPLVCE